MARYEPADLQPMAFCEGVIDDGQSMGTTDEISIHTFLSDDDVNAFFDGLAGSRALEVIKVLISPLGDGLAYTLVLRSPKQ
ncbi:MAG: hypothetical protein CTY18_02995 [Methylomonas sp.]|nr:MAG: hypothetical protein CTY18_02995 [Methylomonas sp.]